MTGDRGHADTPRARDAADRLREGLGHRFRDPGLLSVALTHRSHAFEAGGLPTNERLEFLGDAVLGLAVADVLYRRLPDEPEGRLAKLRAVAVSTRSVADVARGLGVGDAVRLGRGEEQSGGRDKDSILADTLEALLGAVRVDGGIDAGVRAAARLFSEPVERIVALGETLDHKTALQELTAAHLACLPEYSLTEDGPDHAKRFTAVARVDGEELGRGAGRSKKDAEQAAAAEATITLRSRFAVPSGATPGDGGAA